MRRRRVQLALGPARRGFSFIEAIAASVLLAMVASIVMGGVSAIQNSQERALRTLDCAELANRLAIQWLDDPEARPPETIPLNFSDYRWEIVEQKLGIEGEFGDDRTRRTSPLAQARRITVTVWLHTGPESQSAPGPNPSFTLSRYLHLIANRNPDSMRHHFEDENIRTRLLEEFVGSGSDTTNTRRERGESGGGSGGGGR